MTVFVQLVFLAPLTKLLQVSLGVSTKMSEGRKKSRRQTNHHQNPLSAGPQGQRKSVWTTQKELCAVGPGKALRSTAETVVCLGVTDSTCSLQQTDEEIHLTLK